MRVGQKTNMINGVPEPARKRNGVDNIIRQETSSETLVLNHRLSRRMRKNPKPRPTKILGSLMA